MEISQLGINIKKFREEKGWSLKKLKIESGVGYATLHDIENGKSQNLNSTTIEKIAGALNKTTDELMGVKIDIVEYVVEDLESTIKAILESDELKIDDIVMNAEEKEEILELIKFGINNIRRRRGLWKE